MSFVIAFLALIGERILGYPGWLFRAIGHPVSWMGAAIALADRQLNRAEWPLSRRKLVGALAFAAIALLVLGISLAISLSLRVFSLGWIVEIVLAVTLLAQKGLRDAVSEVKSALETQGIEAGRGAVSKVVGRDTQSLDQPEIARAAIETLAENTSDGVIAPLFYLLFFGLPGIALYKFINTADSMIGYRNEKYGDFGWAAAKTDDVANFLPARLTGLLFAICAPFAGGSMRDAQAAMFRDARKHASPNAGWPEAAMAGALGFSLGGPRRYHGALLDLPHMGDGRRNLGPGDIVQALTLYDYTLLALWALTGLGAAGMLLAV